MYIATWKWLVLCMIVCTVYGIIITVGYEDQNYISMVIPLFVIGVSCFRVYTFRNELNKLDEPIKKQSKPEVEHE